MLLFFFALFMLCANQPLQPQNTVPQADTERVFWSVSASQIGGSNAYVVFFDAEIIEGWYFYSLSQEKKSEDLPPPAITFEANPQLSFSAFINEIGDPKKEIDAITKTPITTLSGKVTYNTVVTKKTKTPVSLQGYIDYSICTKGLCTKPPRKTFEIVLN
ncbi:MAG TPA: hypothetical protein PK239_10550 [Chitinophagales bacterium]|nr:hypothetical protein [Chitinophagales bacterium]